MVGNVNGPQVRTGQVQDNKNVKGKEAEKEPLSKEVPQKPSKPLADDKYLKETDKKEKIEDPAEKQKAVKEAYKEMSKGAKNITGSVVNKPEPERPPYDASKDIETLYKAMDGWGTDEKAIHSTLGNKTPEEIKAIKEAYKKKYGKSLEAHISSEMSGNDWKKARSALDKDRDLYKVKDYDPTKDAEVLKKAVAGVGTDEKAVFNVLDGKSPEQREVLKKVYEQKYGEKLETALKGDLSGGDMDKAKALLDSGKITDADKIRQAVAGTGTDEKAVYKALEGKSPDEISKLKKEYKDRYGVDLEKDLKGDLNKNEMKKADLLLKGEPQADMNIKDQKEREADLIKKKGDFNADKIALEFEGKDKRSLLDTLHGKSPEERESIKDAYKKKYGKDLEETIKENLSGSDKTMALSYLKNGEETGAEKLHRAMEGLGTDEKLIFRTLEGKSQEERDAIIKEYKEKYGSDLSEDLKGDLSGSNEAKALQLLSKGKLDTAGKLDVAMSGAGTDEKGVFEALEKATPEEREKLRKDEKFVDRLKGELSGEDETRALELLNSKDGKLSAKAKLNVAMAGLGTNEKGILTALEEATPEERKAILKDEKMMADLKSELNNKYMEDVNTILKDGKLPAAKKLDYAMSGVGTDEKGVFDAIENATPEERKALLNDKKFMSRLDGEMDGTDYEKAKLLLKQGKLDTRQKLDLAMKGFGTDEKGVFDAIGNATPEERKALLNDKDFMSRLDSEMDGNDYKRAKILLEKGKTSSVEDLHLAMKGLGTDEDSIFKTLSELKTDKDKEALIQEYRGKYKKDLLSDLKSELSTSDYYKAHDMLQKEAKTPEERKERMEEKLRRERDGGGFWANMSNSIMDSFGDSGRNLDDSSRGLSAVHREIKEKEKKGEKVEEDLLKKLGRSEKGVNNSIEDYQEAKDKVANGLTTAAAVTTAVVVSVGTAGAGSTVMVPWLIGSSATTAISKVAINKAVRGDSYDALGYDGFKDFTTGAVEGAVDVLGTAQATKLAKKMVDHTARPFLYGTVKGGIEGGMTGGISTGFKTAVDDKTWDDGIGKGLQKVVTDGTVGGMIGVGVGGVMEGVTTKVGGVGGGIDILSDGISEGTTRTVSKAFTGRVKDFGMKIAKKTGKPIKESTKGQAKSEIETTAEEEE